MLLYLRYLNMIMAGAQPLSSPPPPKMCTVKVPGLFTMGGRGEEEGGGSEDANITCPTSSPKMHAIEDARPVHRPQGPSRAAAIA